MKFINLALLLVLVSSCSTQTIQINNKPIEYTRSQNHNFFFQGVGQGDNIQAGNLCKENDNVVQVKSTITGTQVFLTIITLGIYTPMTSKVSCSE